MFTHHAYDGISNQFACAGLIHSGCYGKHTCEQENGYPVDACIGFFFFQAAGDDAEDCAGNSGCVQRNSLQFQSHCDNYADQDETGNNHLCLALRSTVIACACFFLSCLYSCFIHCASGFNRNGLTADEEHVNQNDDGQRNADEGEFEEAEGRKSCCGEGTGNDNVRRSTDHGDGTADVSCYCQRHQFLGSRNICCICDADDNRHEAGNGTGIGRYGGQDDGYNHDCAHQRNFVGTCFFNYPKTDCFSEAGLEHSRANDEHTTEEYYGGVRKTCINLLGRQNAENAECCAGCHSGNCQRDQFGNKQECCYCQYTQCSNGWIHKVSPSF